MQLIFTRHGESEANVERIISNRALPHSLTETGRLQANRLVDQLTEQSATMPILAIYASPILRAQETASIVAERLAMPFATTDVLREFDCGIMEGRGDAEAWQAHHNVMLAWERGELAARIPEGESFADLQQRFLPFVESLKTQYATANGNVVLISHGGLLHNLLPLVLRNINQNFVHAHPLSNCACVFAVPDGRELVCLEWNGVEMG